MKEEKRKQSYLKVFFLTADSADFRTFCKMKDLIAVRHFLEDRYYTQFLQRTEVKKIYI